MSRVDSVLRAGRAAAESLMTAQAVVRRPTGELITDPDTLETVREFEVVYDPDEGPFFGKMKVAAYEAFEVERESAGATVVTNRIRADFPYGAFHSMWGDVATIIACPDEMLVGRHLRLMVESPYKSNDTAYRVFAEVNLGEEVPSWRT